MEKSLIPDNIWNLITRVTGSLISVFALWEMDFTEVASSLEFLLTNWDLALGMGITVAGDFYEAVVRFLNRDKTPTE